MPGDPRVRFDLPVQMRDGVVLSADLYLPPTGDGPFPTILIRTIYDNQSEYYAQWAIRFARDGYAVVAQDCRGRYDSGGAWWPYACEVEDGDDTQRWLIRQPFCDGRIALSGSSYDGFCQVVTAPVRNEGVRAIMPICCQQDNFGHIYVNGVLQLQNAINFARIARRTGHGPSSHALVDVEEIYRRLPLISALDDVVDNRNYKHFVTHSTFDEYWQSYSMRRRYAEVDTPAYFLTGWYDNLMHEQFKLFRGWRENARSEEARRLTRLTVGPWTHRIGQTGAIGDVTFPDNHLDMVTEQLRWFDRRLRGAENGIDDEPPLRLYVMGENLWRGEWEWPLARARPTPYYLHSSGAANSLHGDGALSTEPPGDEPPDRYDYDPMRPVPTHGGQAMLAGTNGPRDRRPIERRDDVLVYTGEPLARDLEVTGPIELVLHAASSAVDTDFTAALVDVHPDGRAIVISEGVVRARFRDSIEHPTPIEPGRVYVYRVDVWETSNLFLAGHRLRVEISSSSFPRFDRNLNTGHPLGMDTEWRVARQTIHHDAARPSHILLPVVPR